MCQRAILFSKKSNELLIEGGFAKKVFSNGVFMGDAPTPTPAPGMTELHQLGTLNGKFIALGEVLPFTSGEFQWIRTSL